MSLPSRSFVYVYLCWPGKLCVWISLNNILLFGVFFVYNYDYHDHYQHMG